MCDRLLVLVDILIGVLNSTVHQITAAAPLRSNKNCDNAIIWTTLIPFVSKDITGIYIQKPKRSQI